MRSLGSFATSTIKQLCSEMGSRHDSAFGNHTTPVLSKIPPARYCTNRENRSRNDKERHCPPREWKLTALMHLERLLSATSALCYTRSCYQYAFIYSVSTTRLYEYHSSTLSNCIWVPANTKCQPSTQSHTPESYQRSKAAIQLQISVARIQYERMQSRRTGVQANLRDSVQGTRSS